MGSIDLSPAGAPDSKKFTLKPRDSDSRHSIAVLIPCHNEGATIYDVVKQFQDELPGAEIYVYDNNSTDNTCAEAQRANAHVQKESRHGKSWLIRRMLANINADYYVLAAGDGRYDPISTLEMIALMERHHLSMVVGRRVYESPDAQPQGRFVGDKCITNAVAVMFGKVFQDMSSGYRVLSRSFAKSFPAFSTGFEIETELTVHALTLGLPVAEVPTIYREPSAGFSGEMSAYKGGLRIAWMIVKLLQNEKPLVFCGISAVAFILAALSVFTFLRAGSVSQLPAILAIGLAICAFISLACGLILNTVTKGRREAKMLAYLSFGNSAHG